MVQVLKDRTLYQGSSCTRSCPLGVVLAGAGEEGSYTQAMVSIQSAESPGSQKRPGTALLTICIGIGGQGQDAALDVVLGLSGASWGTLRRPFL